MATYSTTAERTPKVLQLLIRQGQVTVDDLVTLLEVSPATVRRDLQELEQLGLLRRTHGGAVPVETLLYEPFRHNASFQEREIVCAEEKRRIGLAAAELVAEGETIALTAGTTTTQIARSIRYRRGITVVTNAINIAMELSNCRDLTVIVVGGFLSGNWFSLLGPVTMEAVAQYHFDTVFVGLDGIDETHGVTVHHPDEAAVNRAMLHQACRKVGVADHTKVGRVTTARVCPLHDLDLLITGEEDDANDSLAHLSSCGLTVQRA